LSYYGSMSSPMFAFTETLVDFLREKDPSVGIIAGGLIIFFDTESAKRQFERVVDKLDNCAFHRVPPSGINKMMEDFTFTPYDWKLSELNTMCPEITNPEDITFTYQEILDRTTHIPSEESFKEGHIKMCEMIFSDGCVGRCAFCAIGNMPFVSMSFDNIEYILKKRVLEQGYNSFYFLNSVLNPNRKYIERFCNLIIKNNLNITWSDSARFHKMGPDDYKMMFEAGARSLSYGCETVDDDMLKYVGKNLTVDDIQQGLQWSHEAGIWTQTNFIVGMPYEKPEVVTKLINFIRQNREYIDSVYLNAFRMNISSLFYEYSDKYGLEILDNNPDCGVKGLKEGIWFREIDGYDWDIVEKLKEKKRQIVSREIVKTDPTFMRKYSQHLLIMLYDVFDNDKEAIRRYIRWHLK